MLGKTNVYKATIEPEVVTEDAVMRMVGHIGGRERDRAIQYRLLRENILSTVNTGNAGNVASGGFLNLKTGGKKEDAREPVTILDYKKVETLAFSFENILKIDNLQGFDALTKLSLDNNVIEKIEGLSHLVHLTWLDLSFNNISKIEGLENLNKITVLTLYNNQISELEGIQNMKDLEVFSIGNNKITSLENVMYLRQFKKLRMVHLYGNPFSTPGHNNYKPEYKSYVLAHLKYLKYLDYRLIDNLQVNVAREQYQDELLELEEKEKILEIEAGEMLKVENRRRFLRDCNLHGIETLFNDIMNDDPELPKLKLVEILTEAMTEYQIKFERLTEPMISSLIEIFEMKKKEKEKFETEYNKTLETQETQCLSLLKHFESDKKLVFHMISLETKETEVLEKKLFGLLKDLENLQNSLMELEICQIDIIEGFLSEYEKYLKEIFDKSSEIISSYFVNLREIENSYYSNVMTQATMQWERYNANELDHSISEEGRHLLQDKDGLLNLVNGSHDAHLFKIDAREDEVNKRENDLFNSWIRNARNGENDRNRKRVSEILGYVSRNKSEIEMFLDNDNNH